MTLDLQIHFTKFHDAIKLGTYDENQTLRDKRDLLVTELRANLSKNKDNPSFVEFNQGSYAMNTGITPKDGNYDIDVGLVFNRKIEKIEPVELKKLVRDNLVRHNREVLIRRPCITVNYLKDGVVDYHVDLACYAKGNSDTIYLAKGKEFSKDEHKEWEISEPKKIISEVQDCQENSDDRAQLRRIIRYFKVWRDKHLPSGRPVSIALTWGARKWFSPCQVPFEDGYDDLEAFYGLTHKLLDNFFGDRLVINLWPVAPYCDLNDKMTDDQMSTLKEKLEKLRDDLAIVREETVEDEACKKLRKIFGTDFPVPDKKETAHRSKKSPVAAAGLSA